MRKSGKGAVLSATPLAEKATVTRQAMVKHLRMLADAGGVIQRRVG